MIKNTLIILLTLLIVIVHGIAEKTVTVQRVKGSVLVRYGLEESWHNVSEGMTLRDIDTILSGAGSEVEIALPDGSVFLLQSNSALDIVDLKTVSEKELFLFLMSKKVKQINPVNGKTRLKVGNVSVVHAESKVEKDSSYIEAEKVNHVNQERNGALALYLQKLYLNTIIKLYKMMNRYDDLRQDPQVYYYLAKSFETLKLTGQAVDAYQKVLEFKDNSAGNSVQSEEWIDSARQAIKRYEK